MCHIGFNEPDDHFTYETHVITLTDSTIDANTRFFNNRDEVPRHAISMGVGNIMKAKTVVLVANGEDKAQAIHDTVKGDITPNVPASILRCHPNCLIFVDEAAASKL